MSFATHAAAIRSRFNTQWASTTPIAWPNASYTPTPGTAWVRLTILPATAKHQGLAVGSSATGSRRYREGGLIVIQVFTPENTGDGANQTLCESVAAIFRGVTADGIRYSGPGAESPRVRSVGNDGAGWYQQNVEVSWSADSTA